MIKKIGNIILFLCLINSIVFAGEPQISLFVTDLKGQPFDYIGRKQPFLLQINLENIDDNSRIYEIPGTDTCTVSVGGLKKSVTVTNGVKNKYTSQSYIIKGNKEGKFTFGPVEKINSDGEKIVSNSVKVIISDTPLVHKSKVKPFFLKSSIDKKQIYLYQKITASHRFYYRYQCNQLTIEDGGYDNCMVVRRSKKYKKGTETIDGNEFLYNEIEAELYPQRVGTLEFLPARAFFINESSRYSSWGATLFDVRDEVRSQFLEVEVLPLPDHPDGKDITTVGDFSHVYLNIKVDEANVGKPVIAHYGIQGDGNFELISAPKIKVPESIRSYSSTYQTKKIAGNRYEKKFEFVIQGSEPGEFIIPKQEFIFFNPETKKYQTLYTKPVKIKFIGKAIEFSPEENFDDIETHEDKFEFQNWQIDKVFTPKQPDLNLGIEISEDLFFKFLIGLCLLYILYIMYLYTSVFYAYLLSKLLKNLSFQQVYMNLLIRNGGLGWLFLFSSKKVSKDIKVKEIYKALSFFFELHGFDIYDNGGIPFLHYLGCSQSEKNEWKEYVSLLNQIVYAQKITDSKLFVMNARYFQLKAISILHQFIKRIRKMKKEAK